MCSQMESMIRDRDDAREELRTLRAELQSAQTAANHARNGTIGGNLNDKIEPLNLTEDIETLDRNNEQLQTLLAEIPRLRKELTAAEKKSEGCAVFFGNIIIILLKCRLENEVRSLHLKMTQMEMQRASEQVMAVQKSSSSPHSLSDDVLARKSVETSDIRRESEGI